jgi:hypothetical protein
MTEFETKLLEPFLKNRHFVLLGSIEGPSIFLKLKCSYSQYTDMWWINSLMLHTHVYIQTHRQHFKERLFLNRRVGLEECSYFSLEIDVFTTTILSHIYYACNYLHGTGPFFRSHQPLKYSRISQYFMEPEASLACSQQSSTSPYPQPNKPSPYRPLLFL